MLKQSTKQLIWKLSRFKKGESPPIALFASRRGGSTWMMDVLAANRGLRYINQSFCLFDASSDPPSVAVSTTQPIHPRRR